MWESPGGLALGFATFTVEAWVQSLVMEQKICKPAWQKEKKPACNERTQKVHIYMRLPVRSESKSEKGIIYISK